jgi:superoxide reductase
MTELLAVYKCDVCGNVVEMIHTGAGELICCGQPMKNLKENTVDAAKEKHVPVKEAVQGGLKVTVGSVPHPMEEKHYIEWIEIISGDKSYKQHLKPGQTPEAFFPVEGDWIAREYCNLHGVWKA